MTLSRHSSIAAFLLLLITATSCASQPETTGLVNTADPFLTDTAGKPVPDAVGFVNDFYPLFNPGQKAALEAFLSTYEKKTATEIVVITFDSTYANEESFDAYTLAIANKWGVGKKGKNNGILVGICPDYRRIRIQNGKGIAAILSDQETETILNTIIIPLFQQGKYYEGIHNGIVAMTAILDKRAKK